MSALVIRTPRLDLKLQTPNEVLTWVESLPAADRAEVSPAWVAQVRAATPGDPWALSFRIVERSGGHEVGTCAFKGPPDAAGAVELAYGIHPSHRGRGFATEAAKALTEFAFASERVTRVRAHTKPDGEASARVLTKCGFRHIGELVDPDDGLVWHWERRRSEPMECAHAPAAGDP